MVYVLIAEAREMMITGLPVKHAGGALGDLRRGRSTVKTTGLMPKGILNMVSAGGARAHWKMALKPARVA